jgi:hypothetical protein
VLLTIAYLEFSGGIERMYCHHSPNYIRASPAARGTIASRSPGCDPKYGLVVNPPAAGTDQSLSFSWIIIPHQIKSWTSTIS